jgi:hypothetical protein
LISCVPEWDDSKNPAGEIESCDKSVTDMGTFPKTLVGEGRGRVELVLTVGKGSGEIGLLDEGKVEKSD